MGRLDIVGGAGETGARLLQRASAELRTPETDRNRALALVRYGAVLRNQSKLDESQKALSEAVDVLSKLRQQGDSPKPRRSASASA